MQANGDIERGLPSGTPAGLAWRPRGCDPTPGDWTYCTVQYHLQYHMRAPRSELITDYCNQGHVTSRQVPSLLALSAHSTGFL